MILFLSLLIDYFWFIFTTSMISCVLLLLNDSLRLPSQAVPAVFTWKFAAQAQAAVPSLVASVGQAKIF